MKLSINYPKDKEMLEEKLAYIRAMLIKKSLDEINIKNKRAIVKSLIEKLKTI